MKQLFLILPLILFLSACQTMNHVGSSLGVGDIGPVTTIPQGDCPAVSRVAELASTYQFITPSRPAPTDEISQAHITRIDVTCGTAKDTLVLSLTMGIEGAVGPRGRTIPTEKPHFMYPYFVTLLDSQNTILFKDIHALSLNYDANLNQSRQIETVQTRIPLDTLKGDSPRNIRVLIGFQLTPDEIAYNRTLPTAMLGRLSETKAPLNPPEHDASTEDSGKSNTAPSAVGVGARSSATPPKPAPSTKATIEALKKGH